VHRRDGGGGGDAYLIAQAGAMGCRAQIMNPSR